MCTQILTIVARAETCPHSMLCWVKLVSENGNSRSCTCALWSLFSFSASAPNLRFKRALWNWRPQWQLAMKLCSGLYRPTFLILQVFQLCLLEGGSGTVLASVWTCIPSFGSPLTEASHLIWADAPVKIYALGQHVIFIMVGFRGKMWATSRIVESTSQTVFTIFSSNWCNAFMNHSSPSLSSLPFDPWFNLAKRQ